MKIQQWGIALFLTVLIGVGSASLIYTWFKLKDHPEYLTENEKLTKKNREKAYGQAISIMETKSGRRKWVLNVKKIRYIKKSSIANINGVDGAVFSDSQKQTILFRFTADSGQYDKAENRIVLDKNPRLSSPEASVNIQAGKLEWGGDSDMINATGGVKLAKKGFGTSQAQSARLSMDFSKIEMSGGAVAVMGAP